MRYHLTSVTMDVIEKTEKKHMWVSVKREPFGEKRILVHAGGDVMMQSIWTTV